MDTPYNIGPRVEKVLRHAGMTKAELAARSGIRWAQIQKILLGQRPHVSAETVRRLAVALQISSDYLLGLTDEERGDA